MPNYRITMRQFFYKYIFDIPYVRTQAKSALTLILYLPHRLFLVVQKMIKYNRLISLGTTYSTYCILHMNKYVQTKW